MTTLCIDIGIRNLSMCIMNNNYEILLWDTYNVLDSDDHHCICKFKNGKICGRKCTMKYGGDIPIFTCKTHFPKDIKITKANNFKKKTIDTYLLQDIAKAFILKIQEIYNKNNIIFLKLTSIFIELQPKCNPKMLFISHILYGKLVELYQDTRVSIKFVRASQKLKAYIGPEIDCKLKGAYAKRKWLGIKHGQWFLENKFSKEQKEKWLPSLCGKLDDRFDTFLMAINVISAYKKTDTSIDKLK